MRTRVLEICVGLGATRSGSNMITEVGENSNSDTAEATGCTSDEHFTLIRTEAMFFKSHDREHGGETGGANAHSILQAETIRQRYKPVSFDTSFLSMTAPVTFTNAPARENDLIAGFEIRGL